ncbi:MAG: hypothetical protein LBH01_07580 [Verrucomicrobiales bacterium]|jgi:Tfp pilus assembly protein PilX|nr:hypothetical protein [Verrucomicrobiales bacterium]
MRKHFPTASLAGHPQRGAALIIVLAFVVLLTVLVLAFFSQTRSYQNLANSSFNDFKSATLGQSALQVVIGDLQQEIVNGSTSPSTSGTFTTYFPISGSNAVPRRFGNPPLSSGTDPIPNLIRISSGSDSAALHLASSISSTTSALNGQYVSPSRWNKHYLIPRDSSYSATQVGTNPDPNCGFTAPDWIYVTGTGPIANPSTRSPIIGRYAYAIFNEGGLLDANVAGYPTSMHAKQAISGTNAVWGYANKGNEAFADLHSIGMIDGEIDDLIGWRNYASAQASGDFTSGYKFPDNGKRYYDFIQSNTTGFLQTGTLTYNSITDQPFTSRQQLIKFFTSGTYQLKPLQYLATFTRDTDQPSYVPNPNRPKIQNNASTNSGFGTGNDAKGLDDAINPSLLSVRVTASFTRADGTVAQVGEPLLKRRFPLSRIGLLAGSDTASIRKYFGLESSGNGLWTYRDTATNGGIMKLSEISSREPNFFELLKAAINAGSIGKSLCDDQWGGWQTTGAVSWMQHARDTVTDLQIMQIGANIIDQYDSDNFPTRIQTGLIDPNGSAIEVRGVEDLPYLYRARNWYAHVGANTAVLLLFPEIWNPHDPASSNSVTNSPQNFRIYVTKDPYITSGGKAPSSIPFKMGSLKYGVNKGSTTDIAPTQSDIATYFVFNSPTYESDGDYYKKSESGNPPTELQLTFSVSGTNFREPTMLAQPGLPAGSNLAGYTYTYQGSGKNITGLLMAMFPWSNPQSSDPTNRLMQFAPTESGNNSELRLYLQYQQNGTWVTYDEAPYMPYTGNNFVVENADSLLQPFKNANNWYGGMRTDPRTSRWGIHMGECLHYMLSPYDNSDYPVIWASARPDTGRSFATHMNTRTDVGIVGNKTTYVDNNAYYGFQHGYWAENTVRKHPQDSVAEQRHFNRDPDGIVRRTMGGYASDPVNGGSDTQSIGLPMVAGNNASRPLILNRPFRSVAELGYAFRDTPWGNINFSFPESGDSALLDVFCINDNTNSDALVAGRLDLNTRQSPVIAALISGVQRDETNSSLLISSTAAATIGNSYVDYTTNTRTITNRADLVGSWINSGSTPPTPDVNNPAAYYDNNFAGFIATTGTIQNIRQDTPEMALITRQRESVIRALADCGTARTWNLLIDLVAQSGRFAPEETNLGKFTVEGEKHYWLHVAIDRYTGKVIDSQLEIVNE